MAHIVPLSSAVVCIEGIPAYAGVAVRGYYSWCMSGSLAGQFRLWYALSITSLCWGGSLRLSFLVYVWLSCRTVVLATKQTNGGFFATCS